MRNSHHGGGHHGMEDEDEDEGINFPIQMDGFIEVPGFEVHTMPGFEIFHFQFQLFLNCLQKNSKSLKD